MTSLLDRIKNHGGELVFIYLPTSDLIVISVSDYASIIDHNLMELNFMTFREIMDKSEYVSML